MIALHLQALVSINMFSLVKFSGDLSAFINWGSCLINFQSFTVSSEFYSFIGYDYIYRYFVLSYGFMVKLLILSFEIWFFCFWIKVQLKSGLMDYTLSAMSTASKKSQPYCGVKQFCPIFLSKFLLYSYFLEICELLFIKFQYNIMGLWSSLFYMNTPLTLQNWLE